jgi:hypothetical protein
MVTAMVVLVATMATSQSAAERKAESVFQLAEESPDVFLAKATLQQYLSRVVRKDWDGVKRLTHPKTLQFVSPARRSRVADMRGLAPWADNEAQLKAFRFVDARQVAPGVVAVQIGEDNLHRGARDLTNDDAAVYLLFKSRGSFLVGDKRRSVELSEVTDVSVRTGYSGYVDAQVQAQARRDSGLHDGHHR